MTGWPIPESAPNGFQRAAAARLDKDWRVSRWCEVAVGGSDDRGGLRISDRILKAEERGGPVDAVPSANHRLVVQRVSKAEAGRIFDAQGIAGLRWISVHARVFYLSGNLKACHRGLHGFATLELNPTINCCSLLEFPTRTQSEDRDSA